MATQRSLASGYDVTYTYTYDDNGNILSISDGTNTTSYVYDTSNQLVRENNQAAGKTWTWTYDNGGNITARKEYAYTTGTLGTATDTVNYTYDATWGDLLTGYDGNTITSDEIGNMLSDGTWTYTWQNGRELASMTDGETTWNYTYDADGMRISRTNGTDTYSYVYNGGSLTQMTKDSDVLTFAYDAADPMTVTYNGTTYYYVTNIQGDVVAILNASGTAVVRYTYDAWGNILTTTGDMAGTLGALNPLRYRGYVYDTETGLYYLQSRYYNPQMGRFICADAFVSTGQGALGYNMFAYCNNNPVLGYDPTGRWDWKGVLAGAALVVIGIVVVAVTVATAGAATPLIAATTATVATVAASAVITTGATMVVAAATDSTMVVDVSVSTPTHVGHGKTGTSIVLDFEEDEANMYSHTGSGVGISSGISYSSGFVYGYEDSTSYEGEAQDFNVGYTFGLDKGWSPTGDWDTSVRTTTYTFSSGISFSYGYDYYYAPVCIFEW